MQYKLEGLCTVSIHTTVEANSLEEAIAIAEQRDVEIGGRDSGHSYHDLWLIEDADGSPQKISGT